MHRCPQTGLYRGVAWGGQSPAETLWATILGLHRWTGASPPEVSRFQFVFKIVEDFGYSDTPIRLSIENLKRLRLPFPTRDRGADSREQVRIGQSARNCHYNLQSSNKNRELIACEALGDFEELR